MSSTIPDTSYVGLPCRTVRAIQGDIDALKKSIADREDACKAMRDEHPILTAHERKTLREMERSVGYDREHLSQLQIEKRAAQAMERLGTL